MTDDQPSEVELAWMDEVEIVGDSFDGPIYMLKDGSVFTCEVPEQ